MHRLLRARSAGIAIPHLCYLKDINEIAACRVCCVEVMACPGGCVGGGGQPLSEKAEELLHTDHFGWDMPNLSPS